MFPAKEASGYPTQWALNPSAYQNVDATQVDWATLAQQWIAMKEATTIVPLMKPEADQGEAPMDVEAAENGGDVPVTGPVEPASGWNSNANAWGWEWQPGMDMKTTVDTSLAPIPPMIDNFQLPPDNAVSGYSTASGSAPTFHHGYWTASQGAEEPANNRNKKDNKNTTRNRRSREKPPVPVPPPPPALPDNIEWDLDAAKRKSLPAWIREGLEKMEREKQRAIEKEQELRAREEAEKERKRLELEELERLKAAAAGQPMIPAKSKFESESDSSDTEKEAEKPETKRSKEVGISKPPLIKKTKEEMMQELMLVVRRSLTEILLEVTDHEIQTVSQEELARFNSAQATRLNAAKATNCPALAAISSSLGLGGYGSSTDESDGEDQERDISDQQLQDMIKRKRADFERTSREIEAEVRRAELREDQDDDPQNYGETQSSTPPTTANSRSSMTPPPLPLDGDKSSEHHSSRERSCKNIDSRKLDTLEDKARSGRREYTPSPHKSESRLNNNKQSRTRKDSSSDCEFFATPPDNSSTSKDSNRRNRSYSIESDTKKSGKHDRKYKDDKDRPRSKSDKYSRSSARKDDDDKYKSRSRDHKHRDDSSERSRKRRRSRSNSHDSRSRRRRSRSRDDSEDRHSRYNRKDKRDDRSRRDRSYDRHSRSGRDYDKYDRRDRDRRRSRSRSRHRR